MRSASRKVENQNYVGVSIWTSNQSGGIKGHPTSSTRQLDIHSQVVMLNVASPRGNWHHSVIIRRQGSLRHKVPSRRTGKLGLLESPSFRVSCRSILFAVLFGTGLPGPAVSGLRYQRASCPAITHNSFQICPWVSGRLSSSRLARSRIDNSRGRVSVV